MGNVTRKRESSGKITRGGVFQNIFSFEKKLSLITKTPRERPGGGGKNQWRQEGAERVEAGKNQLKKRKQGGHPITPLNIFRFEGGRR